MLECLNVRMLECLNVGMLECWNVRMLECLNGGLEGLEGIGNREECLFYSNIRTF